VVSATYMLYYLWWRATSTLNPQAPLFSWLLLAAEAFGVFSYVLFSWMSQDISPVCESHLPSPGIKVDVFIPTYNENLDILEATLTGCKRIAYPHQTYLLDDGHREEARELALRLGCHYIARPGNEHAKAGNINHALKITDGEFIVILDADMVPQPDFLHRTLRYFKDESLAFVQMPQEFYNQDSIQHDGRRADWHEQSLFFHVIQPGKNYSKSAFWCGSPSVVRRAALEDVGGVATETITEDIHTSVRLHSRGWSSLFVDEPLAFGIAPQTIQSFLLQRLRWAQGTMQLYRSAESPLWTPGLTFKQRISYLGSFLAYFEAFQKLILLTIPTLIILLDIFPMRVNVLVFLLHWLPYFGFNVLANQVGGRGYFRYFQTERFNILKMVVFIESTLALLHSKPLTFKVTPKSVDASVYQNERRALRAYFVILGVIVGTIVYGLVEVLSGSSGLAVRAEVFAIVWASYNAGLIFSGVWEVLHRQHERTQYRFPVDLRGEIYGQYSALPQARVRIENLSLSGAGIVLSGKELPDESGLILSFDTPMHRCLVLPLARLHHRRTDPAGRQHAGVSFGTSAAFSRQPLFEYLFIDRPAAAYRKDYIRPLEPARPTPQALPQPLTPALALVTAGGEARGREVSNTAK